MDNLIKVEMKNQYGGIVIYPACDKSRIFAEIAGTRTLTRPDIERIKALGYEVEVVQTLPTRL